MAIYIIGVLFILLIIFILVILNNYSKLKQLSEVCDISKDKLLDSLNEKKGLLIKLKDESKNKELIKIINFDEEENIFELEKVLFDARWNLNKLIENKKIKLKKELTEILNNLNKIEEDIEGLKDYYNSKAITYNEKFFKKPFNFFYKLFKVEQKKIFTLRKIDDYEILKD